MHPALVGFGLGFFVALQVGPMSLFLIRSSRGRRRHRVQPRDDRLLGRNFRRREQRGTASTSAAAILLIAGVGIGSLCWVSVLATAIAAARRGFAARAARLADSVAGLGMLGFGGALIYSAARDQ